MKSCNCILQKYSKPTEFQTTFSRVNPCREYWSEKSSGIHRREQSLTPLEPHIHNDDFDVQQD